MVVERKEKTPKIVTAVKLHGKLNLREYDKTQEKVW
jgi:hypothetical protein